MDIGSLAHVNRSRQLRRMKIYDRLLQNCHKRIKTSSNGDKNKCMCVYRVPPFKFGEPVYDLNTAIIYIIDKLKDNGFDVHYNEPNEIYISWRKHISYFDTSNGTSLDLLESDPDASSRILDNMKYSKPTHYKTNHRYTDDSNRVNEVDDTFNTQYRNQSRMLQYQNSSIPNNNTNQLTYTDPMGDEMDQSIQLDTVENYHYGQSHTSKGYTTKYFKELNRKFLEED